MSEPKFERVDLAPLVEAGVLLAANEAFFWRFGLALTWDYDPATGEHSGLHLREWRHEDGRRETIARDPADPVYAERDAAFAAWASERIALLPPAERAPAERMLEMIWGDRAIVPRTSLSYSR